MKSIRESIIIEPDRQGQVSFFGFDIFITPLLVKIGFVLWLIVCLSAGLQGIYRWLTEPTPELPPFQGMAWWVEWIMIHHQALMGVAWLTLGPVCGRIACEFIIIWFKIYERLRDKA